MFDVSVLEPRTYTVQATTPISYAIRILTISRMRECAMLRYLDRLQDFHNTAVTIDLYLVTPASKAWNIDIKPGTFPNDWSCKNTTANNPVGWLSSATFDATTVNVNAVRFGKPVAGSLESRAKELHRTGGSAVSHGAADLNGDGLLDRIFHFSAKDTGFSCSDIPSGQSQTTVFGYLRVLGTPIAGADRLLIKR